MNLRSAFLDGIGGLARAWAVGRQVSGIADDTDLETTERDTGCGQVAHHVRMAAGEVNTVGHRVHTVRHRQSKAAMGRMDPAMGRTSERRKNLDKA